MSGYQRLITRILRKAALVADPRHVEAYMRLRHGTLDSLSKKLFENDVIVCVGVVNKVGPTEAEDIARSFGL